MSEVAGVTGAVGVAWVAETERAEARAEAFCTAFCTAAAITATAMISRTATIVLALRLTPFSVRRPPNAD